MSSISARKTLFKAAAILALSLFMPPVFADNGLDDDTLALLGKLTANPQLICETYLATVLGTPSTGVGQPGLPSTRYWYKPGCKGPKYELSSFDEQDGKSTTSFIINDASRDMDFDDVESVFGKNPLRRFDQQARPTAIYSFSPSTSLIFTKPQNTFRIEKISVNYSGPPLPPPSVFDMQAASDNRKQQILEMHARGQHWESLPTLVQHVKENPGDAEMHYHLARAYKQSCFINQAVAEYSNALYLCQPLTQQNQDLVQKCMDGLAELKVNPLSPEQLQQYHNFAMFQNEQRMKQGNQIAQHFPGVKQTKSNPFDAIEEIDPPATHFVPGTLIPRSAQTAGGLSQSPSSLNLVPLKATPGRLEDVLSPKTPAGLPPIGISTASAMPPGAPALRASSLPVSGGSAGVTLLPNGEPF